MTSTSPKTKKLVEKWFGAFPASKQAADGRGRRRRRPKATTRHRRGQLREAAPGDVRLALARELRAPATPSSTSPPNALGAEGRGRLYKSLVLDKQLATARERRPGRLGLLGHVRRRPSRCAPKPNIDEVTKIVDRRDRASSRRSRSREQGNRARRRRRRKRARSIGSSR